MFNTYIKLKGGESMYKAYKIRIYPNKQQEAQILLTFGQTRFVWNKMLDMQLERYRNGGKFVNAFSMDYLLKPLKKEYPWLTEAPAQSLQQICKDLSDAFKNLFEHRAGKPKYKSKKYPKQSYRCNQRIMLVDDHHIKLPKLGSVYYRSGREIKGKIKSVTIRKSATNKYYVSVLTEIEIKPLAKIKQEVGIDMGVADLVITSDGNKYKTVRFDKLLADKKHYWEVRLARRRALAKKEIAWDKHNNVLEPRELSDFSNYMKAKLMVAKYSEKIANQRKDYLHKISTELVNQYDVIKIEDLKAGNMMRNHKLARTIVNQSWRELRLMLEYKCEWYGKELVIVNPYKTSQICSDCGYDDGKHTLDVREWICPNCGAKHDRDINAAKNILKEEAK
ncbi:transposase [Lactobacillus phage Iacchus]|uniref:Transposase n=1 Tax=Lactobacillus phage Iacchus TaxID=2315483 RepID=A0A3S7UNW1_9CAUD|nr:transposase [Lactobacillus phage Iacchus]AYH91991.1 transposase [Lactobacillus phage Iacchus]AYH92163.1 transposase [Lactobacillus phage Dionysus]